MSCESAAEPDGGLSAYRCGYDRRCSERHRERDWRREDDGALRHAAFSFVKRAPRGKYGKKSKNRIGTAPDLRARVRAVCGKSWPCYLCSSSELFAQISEKSEEIGLGRGVARACNPRLLRNSYQNFLLPTTLLSRGLEVYASATPVSLPRCEPTGAHGAASASECSLLVSDVLTLHCARAFRRSRGTLYGLMPH